MVSGATLHGDVPWPDVARLASELSVAGVSMAPTPEMWVAAMQGDFDAARAISDDFIEGQRERGLTLNVFTHRLARGYIEHVAGAAERAVEALRWAREAAARKGSTVLVERADRLTAGLDA